MPPVALPARTTREFAGETATEFMRPLVSPQFPRKEGHVEEGPIERQPSVACGVIDSVRNFEADLHARTRASDGIEFDG